MARYIVRTKITSSDPTNTTFRAFQDDNAISIMQEYYADERAIVTDETTTLEHRIIEHSFTDEATYQEIRSRLNALGDYRRNDVTIEIVSEGNEDNP